jgi:hypothetical protein
MTVGKGDLFANGYTRAYTLYRSPFRCSGIAPLTGFPHRHSMLHKCYVVQATN